MDMAVNHISNSHFGTTRIFRAYRNSRVDYFKDIMSSGGIMRVRRTDYTGDQRNPINGQIMGLYFCVNLFQGHLPDKSPFGPTRVIVPLDKLITNETELYFADFYCFNKETHYVRLVVTRRNSKADKFCNKYLVKLDIANNHFLYKIGDSFYCCGLWVEILYTENVNLKNDYIAWQNNITNQYIVRDMPKCTECEICNLNQ